MSNFDFLQKEWPLVAKLAQTAENYIYDDPNSCLIKLGMLAEHIVSYIVDVNGIVMLEDANTQADKIRQLKAKALLPRDIDDILYGLRKARNEAVHANLDSFERACLMLELAYKLCIWFNATYGTTIVEYSEYILPEKAPNYAEIIEQQEAEIFKLKSIATIAPIKHKSTVQQNRRKSEQNAKLMTLSEKEIRFFIDEQLRKAGWEADTQSIRYSKGTRPIKGRNMAIAEWPTNSSAMKKGYADYALFVGEQLVGLIDAKKPAEDVASTIDVQIKDYAKNIKPEHAIYVIDNWFGYSVPFLFATNGRPYLEQLKTKSGIWFLDARKPSNISYPIRNWFSPDDLMAKLKHNVEEANEALTVFDDSYMTDSNGLNLRDYQIKAINKVSQAIIDGQQNVLIAMATGTGKTRTVLGLIYKMLESKRFKRILFLVDRTALGGQAMDTFKDVKLKELQTLCQIYDVKDIEDRTVDIETKVSVSTVQGLLKRTILAEKPELTSGAFDLIIVDEAHRGYILDKEMTEDELLYDSQDDYLSKYKQVIEYFDAVKVGLTATPALHTTQIFGSPVFTYSYREAVIDGWLVDHDPPYIINTDFNTSTVTFKKGEQLGMFDPNTGELINGETLQDELDFDVADFNRTIVLPDHTRKVLQEVSKYINPESREKTLIFAVNDNHADNIVTTLREIYKEWGVSNDAIVKITGKTASGNKKKIEQVIKQYKNNQYPNIAVTVDLLTTGIDVPSICNLVFMRKINSRILYEQMLGRATRLCKEINKTHFNIFDPAHVYDDLGSVSSMKSVSVNKTMTELIDELSRPSENSKQQTIDRILAKLQRKNNALSEEQRYEVSENIGKSIPQYVASIKVLSVQQAVDKLINDAETLVYIESIKPPKKGKYYSERKDTLQETTRGYGKTDKPEDYLESFTKFINENKDKIEAIKIVCTKPSDLTRAQLRELKLALDKEGYNENSLNEATSAIKNADIVADIISYVRNAVLDIPVYNREDKIKIAFEKLIKAHSFNKIQIDLLEKIKTYMLHESLLNIETFEAPAFKMDGGFNRFNVKFEGKLLEIIREINTYIYEQGVA